MFIRAHDSINRKPLAVTHVVSPHFLYFFEVEFTRATELKKMSIDEPRILVMSLTGNEFFKTHQHLRLVFIKLTKVAVGLDLFRLFLFLTKAEHLLLKCR